MPEHEAETLADHIQQPWDIEADQYQIENDAPLEMCRDRVIIDWLVKAGDTRPYVDWVLRYSHTPAPEVVRLLAVMMHPEPLHQDKVKFSLVKKKRGGGKGRIRELAVETRNDLLARNVAKLMEENGLLYDSAITDTSKMAGLSRDTIKAAYDKWKKGQGN